MNKKAKILIVEDEMIIAAKISLHLTQMGYEVAGIIPTGEEAISYCRDSPPDILLLDINLRGDIDGVMVAKKITEEIPIPIIYLTANSDEHNFQRAKSTKPFAFISKPLNKIELKRAIELVVERLHDINEKVELKTNKNAIVMRDRIFIRHKDSMVKILLEDIDYLEADRSYCKVCTRHGIYVLSNTLKNLEEKISDKRFLRIHRSYIINMEKIEKITDSQVLIGKTAIAIGRSFRDNLMKRLPYI